MSLEPPELPAVAATAADGIATSQDATPWLALRRHTAARIALGRVGASMPTAEVLAFGAAHARARDAVHSALDTGALAQRLALAEIATLRVWSQAADRTIYLRRPDLGRRLAPECIDTLRDQPSPRRLTVVVADGLSSRAAAEHAAPFLATLRPMLSEWSLDAVVLATQARVALADEIGMLRGAEAVVILLGERPGLSSADSLGIYLTYAPRPWRSDAERNCVSNVRPDGLSYAAAARKLCHLLRLSRAAGCSGVTIKDTSELATGPLAFPSGFACAADLSEPPVQG